MNLQTVVLNAPDLRSGQERVRRHEVHVDEADVERPGEFLHRVETDLRGGIQIPVSLAPARRVYDAAPGVPSCRPRRRPDEALTDTIPWPLDGSVADLYRVLRRR